jgi:hypothetical protein
MSISVIDMILKHVADSRTAAQLLRRIVYPALEAIKSDLDQTVSDILAPHQTGHPITYNHYFTDNLQKLRQKRRRAFLAKKLNQIFGTDIDKGRTLSQDRTFDIESLLNNLMESSMPDMDRFACSESIDGMMAYYKVKLTFSFPCAFLTDYTIGSHEDPCGRHCSARRRKMSHEEHSRTSVITNRHLA